MPDTLTESYLFTPAWFKAYGDGSFIEGVRAWWDGSPATAYAPNDDENHTIFWAEAMLYYALVDFYLFAKHLVTNGDIPPSQVTAKRAHEAAHEPILGEQFEPLEDEGRSEDGGLNHVPEETDNVMIPRGTITSDERGIIDKYKRLVEEGHVQRRFKVF